MRFLVVFFLFLSTYTYSQIDSTKKYKAPLIRANTYQGSRITAFGGSNNFGIQYSPKFNKLWIEHSHRRYGTIKELWLRKMNHYIGLEIQNEGIGLYGVLGFKIYRKRYTKIPHQLFSINYEFAYRYNWNRNSGDYSHRIKIDDIKISKSPYLYIGYFVEYNQFQEWRPVNFSLRWFIPEPYRTIHPTNLWYRKKW